MKKSLNLGDTLDMTVRYSDAILAFQEGDDLHAMATLDILFVLAWV